MIRFDLEHPELRIGFVQARGVHASASEAALLAAMESAERDLGVDPTCFSESTRSAIRNLLRRGGYKPTGRGKPASEFLFGVAVSDVGMPRVNTLVDINNLASLRSAHPISMFDADLLGGEIAVRFGREGESYVFNASGQSMGLTGLLVVCRGAGSEPVGNPVKDSMLCKVHEHTRNVLAVVYGTRALPVRSVLDVCEELARLLRAHAGALDVTSGVLPAD
jgi:DNA/RNA-binding domain of Phe-tRNA-synthetase-like protein